MSPVMEKAAAAKVDYDQRIIDIAERTGAIGQMLAPLKGMERAAVKLAVEENFDVSGMKDLLRSTIVVNRYAEAQAVLDEIGKSFDILRIKNRSEASLTGKNLKDEPRAKLGGYADVLVNVVMPNGVIAEIQINTPEMLSAKEAQGHKLYEVARDFPEGSAMRAEVNGAMRGFYDAAFAAAGGVSRTQMPPSGPDFMSGRGESSAPSSENLNQAPSGNRTNSSPPTVGTNVQPGGNFSGAFMGSPSENNVPQGGAESYTVGKQGGQDDNAESRKSRTQGQEPDAVPQAGGERGTQRVRDNQGGGDLRRGGVDDYGTAPQGEVGQARATGGRGEGASSQRAEPGDRTGRDAGVPDGRLTPDEKLREALDELGAVIRQAVSKMGGVRMFNEEERARILPALVKVLEALYEKGVRSAKAMLSQAQAMLKKHEDPFVRSNWNKLTQADYATAAQQAIDNVEARDQQGDLFAAASKPPKQSGFDFNKPEATPPAPTEKPDTTEKPAPKPRPAGRDIPPKTGRNFMFGDNDLTYEGSWQKKAEQNVEAVELLKRLEADGRQATRDEQSVLAKFIGWGASEIANTLFGDKLDAAVKAEEAYAVASKAMDEAGRDYLAPSRRVNYRWESGDPNFMDAFRVIQYASPDASNYNYEKITRAELDKARPAPVVRRWIALRDRLQAALTEQEWAEASRSTQYAHYTSKPIVKAMWRGMARMGFKGGHILEPGAGIGVFPGLMPSEMAHNSSYTGIEFDSITGGILKQLYPDERILVESFVDTKLPANFFTVAAGNPPFGKTAILADPRYRKLGFALHDFFFAKTLDSVQPGGLTMFVTSRYTMDKLNDKARAWMAERADLVGAIRLPQTAFQKNAGTEVVTDVLFLRKKVPGEVFEHGQAWGKSVPITVNGNQYNINEYFVAHPEMVLGKHADTGSMYKDREYTVEPMEGDIEAQFDKAVENLPENILRVERGSAAEAAKVREIDWDPKAKKEGNYYVTDAGVLMQLEGGVGVRVELKNEKDVALLKDFVAVRDALKQAHLDQLNDGEWETSLAALQKAYRAFVAKYGRVLQFKEYKRTLKTEDEETGETFEDERTFRRFPLLAKLDDDPDYTRVMALENLNDETGEITDSQFLLERVLGKPLQAEIRTPQDALLSVLNDVGKVDLELIAGRLGMTDADVLNALGTAIYQDPSVGWVMADEYLSGNVKRKLDDAIAAARSDRRYERNVEALREAQPLPKVASDIVPQLGMAWIPMEVYEQFLFDKAGVKVKVAYNKAANTWAVEEQRGGLRNLQATTDWGTGHRPAHEILAHALNGNPIRITTKDNDGNTISLEDATELANQKLEQMRQAFSDWLWTDATRTNELVNIYNDRFNTIVPRKFDGQHLTLPGASAAWQKQVHPHVKRGVWRIIQSGNTYLAHAVGSGKTAQMVMSAMEQKRLGLIKKPMIVVPNHMLQQMSKEWLEIYPAAKLMVADEKNFHTENRRRWVSRVSMSDVDAVVITHSAFKLLDLDPEFKRKLVEQELTYLRAAYEDAGGDLKSLTLETEVSKKGVKTVKVKSKGQRSPTIKRIEQLIEAMEQQLQEAMSSAGKDANVRFDELGVDMLYVDEAHEFRKLAFSTRRQVKGVDPAGSKRAFDLWIKTRWLKEKNPNRYLVLASGTPVTNTMAELYSVQKLMDYDTLEAAGLEDFDSWASQFGAESTALEQTVGGGYKPETRFNKFVNVGELIQMFRQFADVLTSDHLAALLGDKRPKVEGGGRKLMVSPKTDLYTAFLKQELEPRMVASRAWKPSKDQPNNPDPIIKIIGDGRLAAIDMRFMHPELPNDPDSKLNRMIDGVIRVYKETGDIEYTDRAGKPEPIKGAAQMVFSDLGFGAGVTEHRGFNARAWFEKRLRDAGIPPAQVAFMSDYKKSDAKLKLFKDVNAGRVRILVGSSKNMGTGVNAQQRLIAMHHLDAPWYPADLEQREGRIIRQGNKNKVVQVYAHAVKGTYDEQMWATLARKQFFIDQALSGDVNVREIEDVSEVSNLQQASAMLADDPRLMEAAGLKADIEKLERLYRAHEESRARMYQAYNLAGELIRTSEPRLAEVEKQAARVQQDLTGDKFKAKADGQTFDKRKEWGEAIIRQARALVAKFQEGRVEIGSISGFPVVYRGEVRRSDLAGVEYRMSLTLQDVPEGAVPLAYDVGESVDPVGMSMRATNALADVVRAPERMRAAIADARSRQDALAGRLDAPFQFAQTLADKRAELVRLEEDIAANAGAQQRWILRNKVTGDSVGNIAAENERAAKLKMIPWRKFSDALLDQWEAVQIDPATGLPVVASEPVAGGKLFGIEFLNPTTMLSRGYTGRDAYTQDLFGNPLPDQTRKSRGGKPAPAAKTGNVPSNTPVPAGRYGTTTKLVAHARRDIGARKVTTVDEAATALSYLGRGAVERFDALVTDKDGNPLALVGSFKGALTQTAVYPATIAAEAFRIQGAAHIWFAHNHPGGTPELSQADRWLMNQLEIVFRGTGIQTHGLLALTQEGLYGHTNEGKGKIQPAAGEAFTVDAVEREFDQYGKLGPSLSDPARARQVVPTVANNETGLVLLDSQNQPIAFVPMKPSEALPLKDNGRLDALYRAMSYANAAGAILHDPKGKFTEEQYRNVGSALALIDVKMLDVLQAGGVSLAEKGKSLAGTVVLSRDGTPGIALRDLNAVVARVGKANANLPPVHVLTSPMALDLNNPSQARLREFIENAGALDDVEGAAHEGEIYLFASGLADEARAEHVLATHEVTHYGLRAVFGMELDTVLQSIWATNANIRKRAAALREKLGLASNVAAVEEILADMEPGELVKLNGWRRLVQTLRDWFRAHGFTALADRLDSLMKAGMSEQRKADLLVAEVVTAARDWVKGGKRAGKVASGTVLADARKLSEDLPAQEKWLNTEARARGFKNIDDLAAKDYKVFENLAALWRKKHPAAVMLSRTQPASEETPIKLDGLWTVNAAPKVGEKFIVYRFGNASGELAGRNAGNSWGVVYYIMTQEDYDRPSNGPLGTHIHAYEVEVSKPFGSYVGITRGGNTRDVQTGAPVGRTVNGGGVAYSFERDGAWKAKTLGYVTMDQVRQAIIDRTDGQYSDFDGTGTVIGMEVLNSLFADKIAKAEGFETPRLSRAAAQQTPQPVAARADAILADSTAKWRPVEAIVKAGVQLTRFDRATSALYAKAGHLLDVLTPEKVKAGVVADYGIPGAVLDQRAMMAGRKRVQLRKSEQLIEKLATLTREESRVAYEWLNNDDGQAAAWFESQLPAESVQVLNDVRAMIDELSQEAVRLGQLDAETFKRHRFAYLRRSYAKHVEEMTKRDLVKRQRAIAILGDQYKGRGITEATTMKQVQNIAPEWWKRKTQAGKADKALKGEKFIRLEKRKNTGAGTVPLAGMTGRPDGRLLAVAYWPAGEPIPARLKDWNENGTWEVRDIQGDKLVLWRDFTKAERVSMGEIDEARFAIARTLHGMINDIETGRYLNWLAERFGEIDPARVTGPVVEASERMRDSFAADEWVKVPDTKIPSTNVLKYGKLAGRYLPGPIWNDVRQSVGGRFQPLGETYAAILSAWKTSKTALSPAVHTNNIMANLVMADWHDVGAGHMLKALRILLAAGDRDGKGILGNVGNAASRAGVSDREAAREILNRFLDSGGGIGTWITQEIQKEQMLPLLEALENELRLTGQNQANQIGVMAALQHLLHLRFSDAWGAFAGSKPGKPIVQEARNLIQLYEAEDQVFRLAAWLKAKEEGITDLEAGKAARKSFLDYHINAPWIQAMRQTAFPFIAFTYRAMPMLMDIAAHKPWKLMKLALIAGSLNALGYALSGGDEDDERKPLPDEKAGSIWGLVPKLIRMPWNDKNGSPVFLDVRRFVPVGDIFDTGQTHTALPVPPAMVPGGPLALLGELAMNKQQFTGKAITLDTDTGAEAAGKVFDHLYKAFAPNLVFLPGTYAWTGVSDSLKGKTDSFGREMTPAMSMATAFGVKVGAYPTNQLRLNAMRAAQAKNMEIDRNIQVLKRQLATKGITPEDFQEKVQDQQEKKRQVLEDLREKAQ